MVWFTLKGLPAIELCVGGTKASAPPRTRLSLFFTSRAAMSRRIVASDAFVNSTISATVATGFS